MKPWSLAVEIEAVARPEDAIIAVLHEDGHRHQPCFECAVVVEGQQTCRSSYQGKRSAFCGRRDQAAFHQILVAHLIDAVFFHGNLEAVLLRQETLRRAFRHDGKKQAGNHASAPHFQFHVIFILALNNTIAKVSSVRFMNLFISIRPIWSLVNDLDFGEVSSI